MNIKKVVFVEQTESWTPLCMILGGAFILQEFCHCNKAAQPEPETTRGRSLEKHLPVMYEGTVILDNRNNYTEHQGHDQKRLSADDWTKSVPSSQGTSEAGL